MLISLDSIRAKLLAVIIPLIVFVMLALFALLEYASFNLAHDNLKQRLLRATSIEALALAGSLWNNDIDTIRKILLALEQDVDFLYATVRDKTDAEVFTLRAADKDVAEAIYFEETVPIIHSVGDHEAMIGSLSVAMDHARLYAETMQRLQRNILVLVVLVVVVVIAIATATERTVGYPLRELMKSINLVRDSDIRLPVEWDSRDELGAVVKSYNEMIIQQEKTARALHTSETHARDSEMLLRDAVNSMADGFALFDEEDRLVLYNRKFRDIIPHGHDIVREGIRYREIVRKAAELGDFPDAEGRIDDYVAERVEAHHNFDQPTVVRNSDGCWVLCMEHASSSGGTVSVRTDISEIKQREAQLQLAKEEADSANRAKSRFLANMSHELRTPLNAIIGFSDIIRGEILGPVGQERYREYADDIYNSGSHLLDLINDVLDVSRVEADAFVVKEEVFDLQKIVEDCGNILQRDVEKKQLLLNVDFAKNLPKMRGDRRAMKQVLLNLLGNAMKFTPESGTITVSADLAQDGGILIRVADTGVGMAEADMEIALKPFGRLDNPWVQSAEGTGLGLPLSEMLVKAHGGQLSLESEISKGTVVSIYWPETRVVAA